MAGLLAVAGLTAAEILAIAGLISAIGGFVATIATVYRARKEERTLCAERLRHCRLEAEELAARLHELRLKYPAG